MTRTHRLRSFRPLRPLLAAAGAAVLAACAGDAPDGEGAAGRILGVALGDSVPYHNELVGTGYLRRVVVRTARGADTLEGVLTRQMPVVAGDSVVLGIVHEQDWVSSAFRWTPERGVQRLELPPRAHQLAPPVIGPGGDYIAYLADQGGGRAAPTIARWPSGDVVYTGPTVQLLETEGGIFEARWLSDDLVEMTVHRSYGVGGGRVVVRAVPGGAVTVDTIPAESAGDGGAAAGAPDADATAAPFRGTVGPFTREVGGRGTATLVAVRSARQPGFERFVFEFRERVPSYRVEYVEPPVHQCGSGRPVPLAGSAVLQVRLTDARAHTEAGEPTVSHRDRRPGYPVTRAATLVCDFEGMVEWALGLSERRPLRVLTLESPPRLVVDVSAPPG